MALSWKVGFGIGVLGLLGTVGFLAAPMLSPTLPAVSSPSAAFAPLPVQSSFVVNSASEASTVVASAPSSEPALSSSPVQASGSPAALRQLPVSVTVQLPASDAEKLLEARRAIRSGDTNRALVLLGGVSPNGSMAEERDILTVEAIEPGNKVKAQRLATQFLQQHPHSAYRGRAEAVLAR